MTVCGGRVTEVNELSESCEIASGWLDGVSGRVAKVDELSGVVGGHFSFLSSVRRCS